MGVTARLHPRICVYILSLGACAGGCGAGSLDALGPGNDAPPGVDGLWLEVVSSEERGRFRALEANPGTRLVLVDVEVDSERDGPTVSLAPTLFAIRTDTGVEFLGSDQTDRLEAACSARTMLPGGAWHGCSLAFEVPLERVAALLVYRPQPEVELVVPVGSEQCTVCGDDCVDVTSDAAHCGGCFARVGGTEVCEEGVAVCREGLVRCGSKCVDEFEPTACEG